MRRNKAGDMDTLPYFLSHIPHVNEINEELANYVEERIATSKVRKHGFE